MRLVLGVASLLVLLAISAHVVSETPEPICYKWYETGCCNTAGPSLTLCCPAGNTGPCESCDGSNWCCRPIPVTGGNEPVKTWKTDCCCYATINEPREHSEQDPWPKCEYMAPLACGATSPQCNYHVEPQVFLCPDYPNPFGLPPCNVCE